MSDDQIYFTRPYYDASEAEVAKDVVLSQWVCGGTYLEKLEKKFTDYCNIEFAIGVSSWTSGAFLVLRALGIGAGDEVIVPSSTFIATANVISLIGAKPVFVDVEIETGNICLLDVQKKITRKTKAIMPVDQLGHPCDIDLVNKIADKHQLNVIQDSACALGSFYDSKPIGCNSDITIFSLHARKIITTGEGGMIVTKSEKLAKELRLLRHQGMSLSDHQRRTMSPTIYESYPIVGFNARMTDIQASIGVEQFKKIEFILKRRAQIADVYNKYFSDKKNILVTKSSEQHNPNWQSYQIVLIDCDENERSDLQKHLFKFGIPSKRGVMASHLEAPYLPMQCTLPNTEKIAKNGLQLPIHPGLTDNQLDYIISSIENSAFMKRLSYA